MYSENSDRKSGKVKFYKSDGGFGFLTTEEGDVFFHVKNISDDSAPPEEDSIYYFDLISKSDGKNEAINMSLTPNAPIKDIFNFAYIPFDTALPALAELALNEDWRYRESGNQEFDEYGILRSYIKYTYTRLALEEKIQENKDFAIFNTGLVDKFYEPIFALFERNNNEKNPWRWRSFCVNGQGAEGKLLNRNFTNLPMPAQYFKSIDDIYFDATAPFIEDINHIVLDGIKSDRYPPEFLDKYAGGFDHDEYARSKTKYLQDISVKLEGDDGMFRVLRNRLCDAIDFARRRAQWNYRAVVPQYYRRHNMMSLLLPLALLDDTKIDAALVVQCMRVEGQLQYQGHTIFPLAYAYRNARLVAKPISDWLNQEQILGL